MSTLIEIVNTTPFNAVTNAYKYYVFPTLTTPITGNYTFNLPDPSVQLFPITVTNNTASASSNNILVIYNSTTIGTITAGNSMSFLPNAINNNWINLG